MNHTNSLVDLSSNIIRIENNYQSRKESLDSAYQNEKTYLPKYAPIFEKIMHSLKISSQKRDEDENEISESQTSSSDDEDQVDIIRDQLKESNKTEKGEKPTKDFRIRNRNSKTSVSKFKGKQKQIESKLALNQSINVSNHTISSVNKTSQRGKIQEYYDKDNGRVITPIQRQHSLKKPAPYGVSIIDNFNIQLLEYESRGSKSPLISIQKSISALDWKQNALERKTSDNRQPGLIITNIKINDESSTNSFNNKNSSFQEFKDTELNFPLSSYNKLNMHPQHK